MRTEKGILSKALSPQIMQKAIQAFDRSTSVVVMACWGAAFCLLVIALYAVNLSVAAKREEATAAAAEPSVPRVVSQSLAKPQTEAILARLRKQFPEINFNIGAGQTISVTANEGSKFRLWLTVLSYIDTMAPDNRWTMTDFCVGTKCGGGAVMTALLKAEKISFASPSSQE